MGKQRAPIWNNLKKRPTLNTQMTPFQRNCLFKSVFLILLFISRLIHSYVFSQSLFPIWRSLTYRQFAFDNAWWHVVAETSCFYLATWILFWNVFQNLSSSQLKIQLEICQRWWQNFVAIWVPEESQENRDKTSEEIQTNLWIARQSHSKR